MFVPIVPVIPHTSTTVVNKTIVYSDTVLSLKEKGNNLKVTSISNVGEYSLENCLKTIFESNPNVVFNTIQYSKNDKKVYFYTNEEISTKSYEESKYTKYKPITNKTEILEEIKNVLLTENNKESDCISLYDVALLLKELRHNYENIKLKYRAQFKAIIRSAFGDSSNIVIYDFDYDKKLLEIGFQRWKSSDFDNISFAKDNEDLYIAKSKCYYDKEVFGALSSKLSNLYDEFMEIIDYRNVYNSKFDTKSINSNFGVDISHFGTGIFVKSQTNRFFYDFKLFSPSYNDEYSLECNSSVIMDALENNKTEIFKRIYVKIDDCPEWAKASLYEIRQNELAEEKRLEEKRENERKKIEQELKIREEKKQKRLELKRKVFPWIKK